MSGSTVTSKGQVTIPKSIREALGVQSGDRVSFVVRDDGVVELRPETVDLRDLFGMLDYRGARVAVEDLKKSTAAGAIASFERSVGRTADRPRRR